MAGDKLFVQDPSVILHWRSFEDEFVAFEQLSGITYRFDVLRAFLLDSLATDAQSEASLIAAVVVHLGTVDATSVAVLVRQLLEELCGAGLVEMVTA